MTPPSILRAAIAHAIHECQRMSEAGEGPFWLPSFVTSLQRMAETVEDPPAQRAKIASGVSRILTDDNAFMKTPVAELIAELVDEYSPLEETSAGSSGE